VCQKATAVQSPLGPEGIGQCCQLDARGRHNVSCRQDDDRDVASVGHIAQGLQEFLAGNIGQHQVEDDKIGFCILNRLQRLCTGMRFVDGETVAGLEEPSQQPRV